MKSSGIVGLGRVGLFEGKNIYLEIYYLLTKLATGHAIRFKILDSGYVFAFDFSKFC